jgi:hypothetical protein
MAESASAPAPKRPARRRVARKSTSRKSATKKSTVRKRTTGAKRITTARNITTATTATGAKRGRPVGSKTRRASSSSPADAISRRVQALVKENQRLRAQVNELEKSWKKLEKALGSNVTRARRAVRKAIDDVTG